MSDQWSGSEEEAKRLADLPTGTGRTTSSNTGAQPGASAGAAPVGPSTGKTAPPASSPPRADESASTMDRAKDALSGVSDKAGGFGSQATAKADSGMDKAAGGLDSLATMVRGRGESLGEGQVASFATGAADRLESGAEMLRGTDSDQLMTDLEALIRRRPVESLLVAAGIGYLLSRAR